MLPDKGEYSIDAKSKMGTASSDFPGDTGQQPAAGTSTSRRQTSQVACFRIADDWAGRHRVGSKVAFVPKRDATKPSPVPQTAQCEAPVRQEILRCSGLLRYAAANSERNACPQRFPAAVPSKLDTMYENANQLQAGGTLTGFDICIAGAGAAGIAMARRLIGSTKKVLLLVNGSPTDAGPQPAEALQQVYGGTLGPFMSRVDPIFLVRSRLNMYGGTTNHFSFNARPLDPADLLPRPGYRSASWPLTRETLNPYYEAANEFAN